MNSTLFTYENKFLNHLKTSIMKNIMIFLALVLFACIPNAYTQKKSKQESVQIRCEGMPFNDKIILAVSDFEVTAPYSSTISATQVGTGMSDMLMNALVNTGCFRVVERSKIREVQSEQNFANGGAFNHATAASIGKLTGAQLLVFGNITEFKENESGVAVGKLPKIFKKKVPAILGGIGKMSGHVGMIIKIVDANTGEILISESLDHKVNKVGAVGGANIFGVPAGGLFFKSKAMQDAVEQCIINAVELIAEKKDYVYEQRENTLAYNDQMTFHKAEIILSNADYNTLRKLSNFLNEQESVQDVTKSLKNGSGILKLTHTDRLDQIVDVVVDTFNDIFAVTRFEGNKVNLRVIL